MSNKKPRTPKYRRDQEKIKDVPVANEDIYKRVALKTGCSPKQVEELVKFTSLFIHKTIKRGAYQTVMLPFFGKWQPNSLMIQWKAHSKVMPNLPTHHHPKQQQEEDEDETF